MHAFSQHVSSSLYTSLSWGTKSVIKPTAKLCFFFSKEKMVFLTLFAFQICYALKLNSFSWRRPCYLMHEQSPSHLGVEQAIERIVRIWKHRHVLDGESSKYQNTYPVLVFVVQIKKITCWMKMELQSKIRETCSRKCVQK